MNDMTTKEKIKKQLSKNYIWLVPVYLEIAFHLMQFGGFTVQSFLISLLAGLTAGFILQTVCGLFHPVANKVLSFVLAIAVTFYYLLQVVYFTIFKTYMGFYLVYTVGGNALQFTETIIEGIQRSAWKIAVLILPLIVMIVGAVLITDYSRRNVRTLVTGTCKVVICVFLLQLSIMIHAEAPFSTYETLSEGGELASTLKEAGFIVASVDDITRSTKRYYSELKKEQGGEVDDGNSSEAEFDIVIVKRTPTPTVVVVTPTPFITPYVSLVLNGDIETGGYISPDATPKPTKVPTPTPTPTVDVSPNTLGIDFYELATKETNADISNLHYFFANEEPTNKNQYTGMFEGYNLIFLTCESWSPWAVSEELTPTLYSMLNSGFVFENYYNPLWGTSTIDGEFIGLTSLVPSKQHFSKTSIGHYMPTTLGNSFATAGYRTYAYHPHTVTYYSRQKIMPTFGYSDFTAVGQKIYWPGAVPKNTGFFDIDYWADGVGRYGVQYAKYEWPESDREFVELTCERYMDNYLETGQPFQAYYMTVSGHCNYNFSQAQAKKHKDEVADLPYSDEAKAYIACNIELELAVRHLIDELTERGMLDNTVFVLTADHYPYEMSNSAINELAGEGVAESDFEKYHNGLIIWNNRMETVQVDKLCSPLDVLPTLLNLFGIPYESRLYLGKDIFSDAESFVVFYNKSFMTDKVSYSASKKAVVDFYGYYDDEYISDCIKRVKNLHTVSEAIITKDYYSYLKDYLPIKNEVIKTERDLADDAAWAQAQADLEAAEAAKKAEAAAKKAEEEKK